MEIENNVNGLVESMLSELEIQQIEEDKKTAEVGKESTDSCSSDSSDDSEDDEPKKKVESKKTFNIEDDEDEYSSSDAEHGAGKKTGPIKYVKTKDELTLDDLPAVESINVQLDSTIKMELIGQVMSKVDKLVIIKSTLNQKSADQTSVSESIPPLDEDTILFDANRKSLGKIYEVFGPVSNPFYSIRFNDLGKEINERGIELEIGSSVYAAQSPQFTKFIFNVNELRKMKGSDASWSHDNEPPVECLDYSDDEKEREAKRALKKSNVNKKNLVASYSTDSDEEEDDDESMVITDKPMKANIKKSQSNNSIPQRGQFNNQANKRPYGARPNMMPRSQTFNQQNAYMPGQSMSHGYPMAPPPMYAWPSPQGSLLGQPMMQYGMPPNYPPPPHMINPYMYPPAHHSHPYPPNFYPPQFHNGPGAFNPPQASNQPNAGPSNYVNNTKFVKKSF